MVHKNVNSHSTIGAYGVTMNFIFVYLQSQCSTMKKCYVLVLALIFGSLDHLQ